jgi:hypothetical protein
VCSEMSTRASYRPTIKYFEVGLRRDWPVLHNQAAKYFLILVFKVAPSKKVSFLDHGIENLTAGAFETTKTPPKT